MEDLEKALARYWSWVEKALFAFAFVASVTIVSDFGYERSSVSLSSTPSQILSQLPSTQPWPVISAVSRRIQSNDEWAIEEDTSDITSSAASAAAATVSALASTASSAIRSGSSAAAETITSAARTATSTAARFVRRQADAAIDAMASDSDDSILSDYDDEELWPGYSSWDDGYSSDLRWAAIGILIGVVIAVWLPWFIVTMRVSVLY